MCVCVGPDSGGLGGVTFGLLSSGWHSGGEMGGREEVGKRVSVEGWRKGEWERGNGGRRGNRMTGEEKELELKFV